MAISKKLKDSIKYAIQGLTKRYTRLHTCWNGDGANLCYLLEEEGKAKDIFNISLPEHVVMQYRKFPDSLPVSTRIFLGRLV